MEVEDPRVVRDVVGTSLDGCDIAGTSLDDCDVAGTSIDDSSTTLLTSEYELAQPLSPGLEVAASTFAGVLCGFREHVKNRCLRSLVIADQ